MAQPSVRWGEAHTERERKKPGQAHLLRQAWAHNRESSVWVPRSRPWGCYTDASEHFRKCPRGSCKGMGRETREDGAQWGDRSRRTPDSGCCGVLQVKLMPQSPEVGVVVRGEGGDKNSWAPTSVSTSRWSGYWLILWRRTQTGSWGAKQHPEAGGWCTELAQGLLGDLGGALIASPWRAREERIFKKTPKLKDMTKDLKTELGSPHRCRKWESLSQGADLPLPAGETSLVIALLFLVFWGKESYGWQGKMGGWQRVEASRRRVEGPSTTAISAFLRECLLALESCSVAQSYLTICNPKDCSTPGFPVHHHLPELAQTHVHWVGDAIQPSHPLSSPSPPAFNLSQHQGLF